MSGDGSKGRTSARGRADAALKGLIVVTPKNNELFIDIDSDTDLAEFDRNYGIIDELFGIDEAVQTPSRNKKQGKHIVVTLAQPITPLERVLLQAILGSDRKREALSLWRIRNNDPNPTLFFEKSESSMLGASPSPSTSGEGAESSPTPSGEILLAE
jgi:hypothetical protein